jgi:hypothetical protein
LDEYDKKITVLVREEVKRAPQFEVYFEGVKQPPPVITGETLVYDVETDTYIPPRTGHVRMVDVPEAAWIGDPNGIRYAFATGEEGTTTTLTVEGIDTQGGLADGN